MLNLNALLNPSTPTPTTTPTTRTPARTPRGTPKGTPRGTPKKGRTPQRTPTARSPIRATTPAHYGQHHHHQHHPGPSGLSSSINPEPSTASPDQYHQEDVKMSSESDSGTESDTSTDSSPMISASHHRHLAHPHHRPHNHHIASIHSTPSKGQTAGKTLPALRTLSQSVSRVQSDESGSDDDETESEDEESRERGRMEMRRKLGRLVQNATSSDEGSDDDTRDEEDDDATEDEVQQTGIGIKDDDETETESDDSEGGRKVKPMAWERAPMGGTKRRAEDIDTSPPPEPHQTTKHAGGSKQKQREDYSRSPSRTVSRASSVVPPPAITTLAATATAPATKPKAPAKPKASKAPKSTLTSSPSMPAAKKKKASTAASKKKNPVLANLPPILPPSPTTTLPTIPIPKAKAAPKKKGQAKVVSKKKQKTSLPPSNLSADPLLPSADHPSSPAAPPVSQTLYCICRLPDTGKWMIACDGCDDWFHGACVNIPESQGDLIDKYYCPGCAAQGKGITTWKRMCRLPGCRAAAKTDGKNPSKYCSKEHGVQFFRLALDRSQRQKDEENNPLALEKRELKNIVDTLASAGVGNSAADFKALGERIPTPPLVKRLRDGEADAGIYQPELMLLNKVKSDMARLVKQKIILNKRKMFLQSCIARREKFKEGMEAGGSGIVAEKAKGLCAFDERLLLSEDRFLKEVANVSASMVNSTGGTMELLGGDLEMSKQWMCTVKQTSCERHRGWGKKFLDEIEGEEGLVEEELEELRREEGRVGERLKMRVVRNDLGGGGCGWVEVEG